MTNSVYAQQDFATATWENPSGQAALISKIFIDGQKLSIVAYNDHQTGERSWGWAKLKRSANGFEAVYQQGFSTCKIFLKYLPKDILQVTATTAYKDDTDPNVRHYYFTRTGDWGNSSSKK
ncbi:MAG: hypothetical protein SF052_24785 [Bacteroidia bacterium]|nr:hypothetical protein [Bacteroidia bacterium]